MTRSSIYVTYDYITPETGAGKVCLHEIEALKRVTDLKQVISRKEISEKIDHCYPFNPFLYDYFATELVKVNKIDIAHLSCSPANSLIRRLRPKKTLVNIVAYDLQTSIEEHERILTSKYPFVHNTDPYLHSVLLKHAKEADLVITPSKKSRDWIIDNLNPKRIEVIPHGTDVPSKVEEIPFVFRAGYLGVYGPDKGLIYLVMAWDHLNYPDAELVFAGHSGVHLRFMIPFLEKNNARYSFPGWIPDVSLFYNLISVYVQPSVSEGFGMPVLEAMAHGRPVVVTEGVGSSYLVEDGKEGLIVPIRDPKAIADAIQYFYDNESELKRMGRNARIKAEGYSWDKIETRYQEVYSEA